MTERERLTSQLAKAEAAIRTKKTLTPKQMLMYYKFTVRAGVLDTLKMVVNTAPRSMDPEKIREHWTVTKELLGKIEPNPSEKIKALVTNGDVAFSKKADTVLSYSGGLKKLVGQFLSELDNQHKLN